MEYPKAQVVNALSWAVGHLLIGLTFGLGWVGVVLVIETSVDWFVRLWHYRRYRPDGGGR